MSFVSRNPELSREAVANNEIPSGSAACIGVITLEDLTLTLTLTLTLALTLTLTRSSRWRI